MSNTITLNSETVKDKLNKDSSLKSPSFDFSWSLAPIVVYSAFLATCLALAYGGLVVYSIIIFILGSIGLAALYLWNNSRSLGLDLSFEVDLAQSELERDLYREVA